MSIAQAIEAIDSFQGSSLTESLSDIESQVVGLGLNEVQIFCGTLKIDDAFLASALSIKKVAVQINVVGTEFPLKFFKGARALTSVLRGQPSISARITAKYGASIERVCDYYDLKKQEVKICDVSPHIGRC